MPSTVPNADLGIRNSLAVRSAARKTFLWSVRDNLIALARAGTLKTTLKDRAGQLNELGVRTTRGELLDEFKLSPAMRALGADANAIRGWLIKAEHAADEFGCEDSDMIYQLWKEWLYHESACWVEYGMEFSANSDRPFIPNLVHPHRWIEPHERGVIRACQIVPASPPAARLVYALFGMFQMSPPSFGGYKKPRPIESESSSTL